MKIYGNHFRYPKLWIKRGNEDEIEIESITPNLKYLGDDEDPIVTNTYLTNLGGDGSYPTESTIDKNVINARFYFKFGDWWDYKLAKHDIYRYFSSKEIFRIRTDGEPGVVKYVKAGNFTIAPIEQFARTSVFTIPFENPSGYKYSLTTSDQLMNYDQEAWMLYGGNIPNGENLDYHFINKQSFRVFNASDITIDPYFQRHELNIIMEHFGDGFKLINNTTKTIWSYKGQMNNTDKVILQGINTFKNGILDNNNTDFGYITLATGWNEFSVVGAGDLDITFSFPFIYLG